jgi:hypothetical protein
MILAVELPLQLGEGDLEGQRDLPTLSELRKNCFHFSNLS